MRKLCVLAFLCLTGLAMAQVNYTPMPTPKMQFTDQNGVPLAGGFVWTYQMGTSTPQATYTDYTGAVQNSDPVVLDSAGRATIFLGGAAYKFVVMNSASVTQYTVDGVVGPVGVLAAPSAIGGTTPNAITGTVINAISGFQVNGAALNFSNLSGWPGAGIPNSTGSGWGTSYSVSGTGNVALTTSPVFTTPNIGNATGTAAPATAGASALGTGLLPYSGIYIGAAATNNAQITGTFGQATTLTAPDPGAAAASVSYASVQTCGTTTTCSATIKVLPKIVIGSVALTSGSPSTATVTGFSPAFTSSSTYFCTVGNATTAADGVKVVNASASSITLTGPNTVTDTVNYICVGY